MKYELKPISAEAIPAAIEKVHLYRGLNEPAQAESICLDILEADPGNSQALVLLLLCQTDQFGEGTSALTARQIATKLPTEYDREYYSGLVHERSARALMKRGTPGSSFTAFEEFQRAMQHFERAEKVRPSGNDDALLRWNACARLLMRRGDLRERPREPEPAVMSE